jgi:hypothetical protein
MKRLGAMIAMVLVTRTALAQAPRATPQHAIWSFTYLKANAGAVDDLVESIRLNWFAMDARAVARGDLMGYHLVRGTPADSSWDLLEVTVWADSAQHARADSIYRVHYRPSHTPVLVKGKRWQDYGRIVRTETTRWLDGGPPLQRGR